MKHLPYCATCIGLGALMGWALTGSLFALIATLIVAGLMLLVLGLEAERR